MKFCLLGDAHMRYRSPVNRKETDFLEVSLRKMEQVHQIAEDHKCCAIIQAGDLFDSWSPSLELVSRFIDLRKSFPTRFLTIYGNHDLTNHSLKAKNSSAHSVLRSSGAIEILDRETPKEIFDKESIVEIYGASFGEEPITTEGRICFRILVAHVMVGSSPLYSAHDIKSPQRYVAEHPGYDLYHVGDYHYSFLENVGDAVVNNSGCMLRMATDTKDRTPLVRIIDTEDVKNAQTVELKVDKDVFVETVGKKDLIDVNEIVEKLRRSTAIGVSFRENLLSYCQEQKIEQPVRDIIEKAYGEL